MMRTHPSDADPDVVLRVRESFARQGLMAHLGAALERIEPGLVTIVLPFRPELSQQHGFFHGGVVGAIADSAGGYAALTRMPADSAVLSTEYKIHFLSPAKGDRLRATGRVLKLGRTLTIAEMEVEVIDGASTKLCAKGLQTLISLVGAGLATG